MTLSILVLPSCHRSHSFHCCVTHLFQEDGSLTHHTSPSGVPNTLLTVEDSNAEVDSNVLMVPDQSGSIVRSTFRRGKEMLSGASEVAAPVVKVDISTHTFFLCASSLSLLDHSTCLSH